MSDTAVLVTSVVAAVLTGFTGTGAWAYYQARKRAPIDTLTAVTAAAQATQTMTFDLLQGVQNELKRVTTQSDAWRQELAQVKASSDATRVELDDFKEKFSSLKLVVDAWANWHHWLVSQWSTIRASEVPPAAPSTTTTTTMFQSTATTTAPGMALFPPK